jgi:hypothetical protein
MTTPLVPNYKTDVGRLVTDRFHFQNHIDGYNFRHKAEQIDLTNPIELSNNVVVSNLQNAIEQLNIITAAPEIPDATTSNKGLIQISGDIDGIATNISVKKIQGKSISASIPVTGDVLTWDGTVWTPSPPVNIFNPSGDLNGNNVSQNVIGITGVAGVLRASCDSINFIESAIPIITQDSNTTSNAGNFTVAAQSSTFTDGNGGNLILRGGDKDGSGKLGGISLQIGDTTEMLQLANLPSGQKVLSILNPVSLTSSDMPADTGDMVMYIRDTEVPPVTGIPVNGTILYSQKGQLWIKQSDGDNFVIGSSLNPNIWGNSSGQVYSLRVVTTSIAPNPALALSYLLVDNTATKVDVEYIGKIVGTDAAAQYNYSVGYLRDTASAPKIIGGVLTSTDPRNTAAASSWVAPDITIAGNNLNIYTGSSAASNIKWTVIIKLTIVAA